MHPDQVKAAAQVMYKQGTPAVHTALRLGVSDRTTRRWYAEWREGGSADGCVTEAAPLTAKVCTAEDELRIVMIPDCQVKPGVPLEHLEWCGKYIAAKQPDVIVCIGDFADMPSLSSYDKGKRKHEGKRVKVDIDVTKKAMEILLTPIARAAGYRPQMELTLGNHEARIDRATNDNAELDGLFGIGCLQFAEVGWRVHDFMKPVVINGVAFSHYFPSGPKGLPIGTARALLNKMHMSCVAGHLQGRDIAYSKRADGKAITGIIAGSFYQHDEDYMSPLMNSHFRGIYMLHQVKDGSFDEMPVSLEYLKRRFG